MDKPRAIAWFERLWWGSTLTWLVGVWLTAPLLQRGLEANADAARIAGWVLPARTLLVLAVTVLLWWLVARRASTVGKWLVVAVAALGALSGLTSGFALLTRGHHTAAGLLAIVTVALTLAAAAMLFRAEAAPWFGIDADPYDDDPDDADAA